MGKSQKKRLLADGTSLTGVCIEKRIPNHRRVWK